MLVWKKTSKLTATEEECKETIDDTTITQNKTVAVTKYVENCKPFIASSILFVASSIILTGLVVYFYCKSKPNNVLPY